MVQTTISVQAEDGTARKITKIIGYKDGGFAALVPYHEAQHGFLTRTKIDYRKRRSRATTEDREEFSASDRVKLSYKPDGFVQFSGERHGRVRSGRDPATGEPKGLGILTNPMSMPIMTGPNFGITFWGLDKFKQLHGSPRGDSLTFSPSSIIDRACDASTARSFLLEFFIFPLWFQPHVRRLTRTRFSLPLWLNQYEDGRTFDLQVVRLGRQPFFLGAVCFRLPVVPFGQSGWILNGPGALSPTSVKHVLHAAYPMAVEGDFVESLDYEPNISAVQITSNERFVADQEGTMLAAEVRSLRDAASSLRALHIARRATSLLKDVIGIYRLEQRDLMSAPGLQRAATVALATIIFRSARSCQLCVAAGYVPEALGLRMRLLVACWRAEVVLAENSGDAARKVLSGQPSPIDDGSGARASPLAAAVSAGVVGELGQFPDPVSVETPDGTVPAIPLQGGTNVAAANRLLLETADATLVFSLRASAILRPSESEDLCRDIEALRQELRTLQHDLLEDES